MIITLQALHGTQSAQVVGLVGLKRLSWAYPTGDGQAQRARHSHGCRAGPAGVVAHTDQLRPAPSRTGSRPGVPTRPRTVPPDAQTPRVRTRPSTRTTRDRQDRTHRLGGRQRTKTAERRPTAGRRPTASNRPRRGSHRGVPGGRPPGKTLRAQMKMAPKGAIEHGDPASAGVPGLEPRLTGPEPVGLPITPYPNATAESRSRHAV